MGRPKKEPDPNDNSYPWDFTISYDDDDDEIPEGCAACGGPYPDCCDSCPLFDD